MTWQVKVYNTITGALEFEMPEPSEGSWDTRITGHGTGSHTFPLFNAGVSRADIREFTKGNTYTITQEWDGHVAYAGVIQKRQYKKYGVRPIEILSAELRSAYMNDRMLYGVPDWEFYGATTAVLTVINKSLSGAARAVLDKATNASAPWNWPLDLPADGSGSFSATWLYNQRLKVEDHLKEIEAEGCEIYFRPYIDGTDLRYEVLVGSPVQIGTTTTLDTDAADTPVIELEVDDDYVKQMSGALAFGKGGENAQAKFAPTTGYAADHGVRDTWVNYGDITDDVRLQAAADQTHDALKEPTSGWAFGLNVYPGGPALAAPGCLLSLTSTDDEFIPDGTFDFRVIGLRGGLDHIVEPEVQSAV